MTHLLILLTLTPELNNQYRDRLKAKFPELHVDLVDHHSKVGPYIASADILLTFAPRLSDDVLRAGTRLKWVQALGTGVDNLIDRPVLRKDVIVTNIHGIHGAPVSEAAIGSMLALARDIPRALRAQGAREWARFPAKLLHNKTVGVFGIGAIAAELAPKCKAFGMRTIGVSSAPRTVAGFDRMVSSAEIANVAGEFDFFVLLTPLTEKTRNSVDAKVLAAMKPTSFLINLARGGVVDEPALVEALQARRIGGAALDVFNEEPLPADHPFWAMENVIITTHQGGFCDVYIDYALPTVEANMRCFLNGDIGGMINVVPHYKTGLIDNDASPCCHKAQCRACGPRPPPRSSPFQGEEGDRGISWPRRNAPRVRLTLPPPERGRIGGGPLTRGTKSRQYRATAPGEQMEQLSERLQTPISTAELERRWAAARAAMERDKIDVLLMQNNSDQMGGYVKYFTDLPATNGYPLTVVFPRDDLMTLVSQGPFGGVTELNGKSDGTRRGVKRWYTTPSYSSCYYTAPYDPELAAKALEPYAGGTIGLVGTYQMSFAMVDTMQKGRFSNSKFVDASDMVDRIKVIKSAEEQDLVKRAAAMQDGAMRATFAAVEPGMRDRDIAAIAQCYSQRHGSEHGIYLCASMPPGKPAQFSARHYQNRIIQEGDAVALLVEDAGPGGMYTELGRTCVVGRASQEMKDEYAFALEARKFNLGLLKPGAACKDVFAAYNDFMRKNGRPEEKRLHCHGQGYDLVERPLIRNDEPMNIEKDMNIVVHPTYIKGGMLTWYCDNYLIGPNGPGERLHHFPEEITELG